VAVLKGWLKESLGVWGAGHLQKTWVDLALRLQGG
jgi:hypothetical protein